MALRFYFTDKHPFEVRRQSSAFSFLYLMISMYSRSLPLLSLHFRYMTEASTLAGENVLGSFSREITLSRMVLRERPTVERVIKIVEGNTG